MSKRIVVLISGSGSNLQAIIDATQDGRVDGAVVGVISNKADAYGLVRAKNAGIPGFAFNHKDYADRLAFDTALIEQIDALEADLIVLAGFMRILSSEFVSHYEGRLLNIHPSLLPKYKGLNTHQRAMEAGDAEHGCTVHFVTEELDGGPLVIQARVAIKEGISLEELQNAVHAMEHKIYPQAVAWFSRDELKLIDGAVCLNDSPLPACGYQFNAAS